MARRRRFSKEQFGPTVERLMLETGTTYRELAGRAGVSAGYVNHIVHGNRPLPANDLIEAIAKALDVEPDYFLEYRLRRIAERLEAMPELADRLYGRLNGTGSPRAATAERRARR
jgi:transcriptional regulator with XRE-family HTH domain